METKLRVLILSLSILFGCVAAPPVKNPQFKEASLPSEYRIEGVEPLKAKAPGWEWPSCVDVILNFYGRPLDDAAKMKAGLVNLGFTLAFGSYQTPSGDYATALKFHGFKTYILYDLTQNAIRIKYFLSQNHPIIIWKSTETGIPISVILLTGYDDSKEVFFLCDPTLGEAMEITYKEFLESVPMVKAWADESKTMRVGTIIYPKR